MARLDELAEGIAQVLLATSAPEPLPIDLVGETPAAATFFVRAVIDACQRQAIPLAMVMIDPIMGEGLLRQHPEGYEGIMIKTDHRLSSRIEFFRFPSS